MESIDSKLAITSSSTQGPVINNFHELSMREALRCDLRNGTQMKSALLEPLPALSVTGEDETDTATSTGDFLRRHPSILRLLREAMYRPGGEDEKGNWGRLLIFVAKHNKYTLSFTLLTK